MRAHAALSVLALAACVPPSPSTVPPAPAAIPPATDFNPTTIATVTFSDPLAAAQSYAQYAPSGGEGVSSMDLISRPHTMPGHKVMVFSTEPFADDSVRANQWRIVVRPVSGGWQVIEAGVRYKCWRGANTVDWQKALCV